MTGYWTLIKSSNKAATAPQMSSLTSAPINLSASAQNRLALRCESSNCPCVSSPYFFLAWLLLFSPKNLHIDMKNT